MPRRFLPLILLALWYTVAADARELADYRIGDIVAEDLVAPVALRVVDAEATAALKEKEAMRFLVVLRFDPTVAEDVEADLRAAFSGTRSNFLRAVEGTFGKRRLGTNELESAEFARLVSAFPKNANAIYPVSTNLAALWAGGNNGRDAQAEVIDRLRAVMRQPIRDQSAPPRIKLTTRARLVTVTDRDEELTLEKVDRRGRNIDRAEAIALERARLELRNRFPPEEAAVGRFAASLLRANCLLEEELTLAGRARQTESLWVVDEYASGEVIARRGQTVDRKVMAALQVLRDRTAAEKLQRSQAEAQGITSRTLRRIQWLVAGLVVVTLVSLFFTWRMLSRRRPPVAMPALIGDQSEDASPEGQSWQRRALAEQERANRAEAAVRTGALKQMEGLLQEKVVDGLATQRKELLEAQQAAALEMAELERRLDEVKAPLQERLNAYERRIAELERALAVKGAENRELIRAKILLVRRHLAAERARHPLEYN